ASPGERAGRISSSPVPVLRAYGVIQLVRVYTLVHGTPRKAAPPGPAHPRRRTRVALPPRGHAERRDRCTAWCQREHRPLPRKQPAGEGRGGLARGACAVAAGSTTLWHGAAACPVVAAVGDLEAGRGGHGGARWSGPQKDRRRRDGTRRRGRPVGRRP